MINPSVICMDPLSLRDDVEALLSEDVRCFHIDIMDGIRVRRYGIYPEVARALLGSYSLELDYHFMVHDVARAIEEWCQYGVPRKISFHYNAEKANMSELVYRIHGLKADAIIAFDLDVSGAEIMRVIEDAQPDGIMVLSIIPGLLRQTAKPLEAADRLAYLYNKGILDHLRYIQVDGGVTYATIPDFVRNGCNELICGTGTLFNGLNGVQGLQRRIRLRENLAKTREAVLSA